jgi:hypothetical protein
MKDKQTKMWIPLYVDKWIFGSTRIELEPAERGVFIDLMVLGAKDEGFIRANETTPFLQVQLAGLLNIPIELLQTTIAKCKEFGKIEETSAGIYRICKWHDYQFTRQYIHTVNTKGIPEKAVSLQNCKPIEKNRIEENRKEHTASAYSAEFVQFWSAYPKKVGKDCAHSAWKKKNPPIERCLSALIWQVKSEQWLKEDGQYVPNPATYINQGRWNDVPTTHRAVICTECGLEGVLPKGVVGEPICRKCKAQKALSAKIDGGDADV